MEGYSADQMIKLESLNESISLEQCMTGQTVPKFGLLTNPIKSIPNEIVRFHKLGFDYAEIGIEEPRATPRILMRQRNEILASLKRNRMFALGHSAYWVGFGSSHEKVRRGWIEEAKDMIYVVSALGIDLLNFHFYARLGSVGETEESRNIFIKEFTDAMKDLTKSAAKKKLDLMLENVPPENGNPLESIDYFSQVMKAIPALRFHLDIGHAFIENGMRGVGDYVNTFGDRLAHIHIHDNHGKRDEHLPLGVGKIDFRKTIRLLKEINYDKTITFEVFTSGADAVRSREWFKKQWNKVNL
jgi:sugar phosphate isomerase/epimerase